MSKPNLPRKRVAFTPVPVRERHDGWRPDKQQDFIDALAETVCVDEACARVGMSRRSAYALRRRPDAASFRLAWDSALDYGVKRVADALIGRAVHGVEVPHYYKGELVGTHRRHNDRLAMWLLSRRQLERYGAWVDRTRFKRHPDGAAMHLGLCTIDLAMKVHGEVGENEGSAGGKSHAPGTRRDLCELPGRDLRRRGSRSPLRRPVPLVNGV